jgi:hypothetical protein
VFGIGTSVCQFPDQICSNFFNKVLDAQSDCRRRRNLVINNALWNAPNSEDTVFDTRTVPLDTLERQVDAYIVTGVPAGPDIGVILTILVSTKKDAPEHLIAIFQDNSVQAAQVGGNRHRPFKPASTCCSLLQLERQLQAELDVARSAGTEHRVARIRSGLGEAERVLAAGGIIAWGSESGMIENIEKLHPELGAISLSYMPHFGDGEVHIIELRPPETVLTGVTDRSIGRRRQDSSVLDVATIICER